ncbi:MAG: hypothetical protein Q9223_007774 [Gallowayella weberi]
MAITTFSSNLSIGLASEIQFLLLFSVFALLLWYLYFYLRLRAIPGPLLASFTNLPRVSWVLSNGAQEIHIQQHEKYGKLVRFGPNMVSVGDATEIASIYGFKSNFNKSDFYRVLLFYAKGKPVPTIFATQDEHLHRVLKTPITPIYSMSNLVSFEPYVNKTINAFITQLDRRFVQKGATCVLDKWLQMFAFDVMGEITYSKPLGFLDRGEDVDGVMESIWNYFKKASPVTQIPWVDRLWTKNPIRQRCISVRPNPIVGFGIKRAEERKRKVDGVIADDQGANSRDFLSRFLEVLDKDTSIPRW